jgi:hypothetical protein
MYSLIDGRHELEVDMCALMFAAMKLRRMCLPSMMIAMNLKWTYVPSMIAATKLN